MQTLINSQPVKGFLCFPKIHRTHSEYSYAHCCGVRDGVISRVAPHTFHSVHLFSLSYRHTQADSFGLSSYVWFHYVSLDFKSLQVQLIQNI
ncbi:hypothetical protein AMECASPLE_038468 [Ameca splendens]|uniref:Uncharacterized protein n=1 Tax=Ameca splendens TaxID=208324 RepID=A0ABV0YJX2_9TELE